MQHIEVLFSRSFFFIKIKSAETASAHHDVGDSLNKSSSLCFLTLAGP